MELSKENIIDFQNICRLCLHEKHFLTEIFEPSTDKSYLSIDQKIMACASIEVCKNDGLPTRICPKCLSNLNAAFQFRLQCESADKTLHHFQKLLETNKGFGDDPKNDVDNTSLLQRRKNNLVNKNSKMLIVKKEEVKNATLTNTMDMLYFVNESEMLENYKSKNFKGNAIGNSQNVFQLCDDSNYQILSRKKRKKICLELSNEIISNSDSLEMSQILISNQLETDKQLKNNNHVEIMEKEKLLEDTVKVPCPYCNKRLARIDEHIRLLHRNRVYKCLKERCGAKFSTLKNLQSHQLHCYGLKKAYKCMKCNKEFHRKSNFKAHIRRHGNKDFQCQFCEKAFVDSTGLKRHFLKHHEPEQEVFVSGCCGKKFKSKEGLRKHIQKSICGIQIFQIVSKENWDSSRNLKESITIVDQ